MEAVLWYIGIFVLLFMIIPSIIEKLYASKNEGVQLLGKFFNFIFFIILIGMIILIAMFKGSL